MGELSLRLLGSPVARHGGQPLALSTRKTLALLAYLAVEGSLQPREKLVALLWPESDARRGRAALRNAVMYLRAALGDRIEAVPHLVGNREAVGLNFEAGIDLDVQIVGEAASLAASPLPEVGQFQQAARLSRGPFLDGFSLGDAPDFDEWAAVQREVCGRRLGLVFDRLSRCQLDAGESGGSVETLSRWLAHDPLSEPAHHRLMQAQFAAGDRAAALATYEAYRTRLATELAAEPGPELQALAERLRAQPERIATAAPMRTDTGPRSASHDHRVSESLSGTPFVGRTAEHTRLVELYHAARQGAPQAAVVEGEAGIGKTRLAREFLRWAAGQGADVLEGRGLETSGLLPYQPVAEALRNRLERENAPEDLLADPWLAELSRLLPELRDRYPDLPVPSGDETTARMALFEAIARLAQALAERAAVVLLIDDLQWADAASLDVLHYLGRRCAELRATVLILLTLRSEALAPATVLPAWLSALGRDVAVASIPLGPLNAEATRQLVRAPEPFVQWLLDETGGQPFFINEMLKALSERGLLAARLDERGEWGLDFEGVITRLPDLRGLQPASVRQIITGRLARLTPAAFELLAAAAVLGHDFTFQRLCEVAALSESAGLAALDEVLAGRLLVQSTREQGDAHSGLALTRYSFAHDKTRDVTYTEVGDARRRVLHRRALEGLVSDGAPAAMLARHALLAGQPAPAFQYSLAAADAAMRLFAMRDAIAHYEQARRVLAEQPWRPESTELEYLHLQLGRAYELDGQLDQARGVYEALLAASRESGQSGGECAALNRLAVVAAQYALDVGRARALLEQARQIADRAGERLWLAESEWALAHLGTYAFEPEQGLAHAERALALARELGVQELVARSLNATAYLKGQTGRLAEAEAHAQEASALYAKLGNRVLEADSLSMVAYASVRRGRADAAIAAARTAYQLSRDVQNLAGQANSSAQLAFGLLERGDYGEALALAEQGLELARSCGIMGQLMMNLGCLGSVERALMAPQAALVAHEEARELAQGMGTPAVCAMVASELCADHAEAGNWQAAYDYAVQALDAPAYTMFAPASPRWYVTEALVRHGEPGRAAEDLRRFEEEVRDNPRSRIPYLRALAVLAEWRRRHRRAAEHLSEARKLAEEMGLAGEVRGVERALAKLHDPTGQQPAAN